ncbi:MAG: natural product biosynthesis luciferase-like monooxygenase protein [Candidatus Paceibacteria bacterium]|jgi:natural product biosynthesis luciferase-like monooxygenase protein
MTPFKSVIIGDGSLLIQCGEALLKRGHKIQAVVTSNDQIRAWANAKNMRVELGGPDLSLRLAGLECDWLFSIANLDFIPRSVRELAKNGAINFHDGPLPKYAGLNAPAWALMNHERSHGITWHLVEDKFDEGEIVEQRQFDIDPNDTALTLNARCFEVALNSFPAMLDKLENGSFETKQQDLSQRSYCARSKRPDAAGLLDFTLSADSLIALVRAMDHGEYWNPICAPKIKLESGLYVIGTAEKAGVATDAEPGIILEIDGDFMVVTTGSAPVRLGRFKDFFGAKAMPSSLAAKGDVLVGLSTAETESLNIAIKGSTSHENHWRDKLAKFNPAICALATDTEEMGDYREVDIGCLDTLPASKTLAIITAWIGKMCRDFDVDIAYRWGGMCSDLQAEFFANWVPFRLPNGDAEQSFAQFQTSAEIELEAVRTFGPYAADLIVRDPNLSPPKIPDFGLSTGLIASPVVGTALSVHIGENGSKIFVDNSRISQAELDILLPRLHELVQAVTASSDSDIVFGELSILPQSERDALILGFNETDQEYSQDTCIHQFFEQKTAANPDSIAVVFEGQSLSYRQLNERANQLAHRLIDMQVGPGVFVGLYVHRSLDLMIGVMAILKAGGAYVPLDPAFPKTRITHYIEDSRLAVIVTQSGLADDLETGQADLLVLDNIQQLDAPSTQNPETQVSSSDLAYLIYTSGSTGTPKGVMVEHRNVSNFFTGMDARVQHNPPGVWLAVTSLSFDISVLELFYTMARGFKLVIMGEENHQSLSGQTPVVSDRRMEFSLYYWGNDDGAGPNKYELLLEGAKFADKNGFTAVWTPERHFHAFGGPYPNPSVTGAAVAAITENLAVRAGSCVAPLHHTARIAEEWAVIDNLTNGRAGMAIASGWQPDDFVLNPQNTPPDNKPAMINAIHDLRKLWRGETVEFPKKDGTMFGVKTQPRPVSKELPVWVTTAGNPATWKEAGTLGANVLTHLLGQSLDEVKGKIKLYHAALRDAGHDPVDFKVTLMLHSYVGEDRDTVREIAREPMKDYLRSAAGLIKQYAWAFPAFKRPKGVENAFELDLGGLEDDELEGILDFAFQRYFDDAGLFGTIEDCLQKVESFKAIGVNEIACLIDYGIPVSTVLEGLVPLAEVLRQTNIPSQIANDDYSIAAQITRHKVTHLQCTPSLARMFTMDDQTALALGQLKHLFLGGEALSGKVVKELSEFTDASIENMYGPTETTIWSSTETAMDIDGLVNIGLPIANTQLYVLDDTFSPALFGEKGELFTGGAGVTRGYWARDDLTKQLFLPDPYRGGDTRMYRTGDLVSRRLDGRIDFHGRIDTQVKLRGYRIELGEIETALEGVAEIEQAVVIIREDRPGDTRLVAYYLASQEVSTVKLRKMLSETLPEYMVPSHFVKLSEVPLTPNKKIDRKALPAPKPVAAKLPDVPTNGSGKDVQTAIIEIWSRILGVGDIGPQDNFFDLGGHSLLAVQAHREIRAALGAPNLNITDIFRFPVLCDLASHLEVAAGGMSKVAEPDADILASRVSQRNFAMAKRRAMRANRAAG